MRSRVLDALDAAPAHRVALQDETRTLSYAALRGAINAEAAWLRTHDVRRCALVADNSAGWVIADLGLLQLQALNVPLPAWFTSQQSAHVLRDAALEHLLTDDPNAIQRDHPDFSYVARSPYSQLSLLRREAALAPAIDPSVVKVTYTSGSTGAAKGVCLTLDAIERVAHSLATVIPPAISRHLCIMPLATLLENIAGVYAPLLLGAACIAPSTKTTGLNYGSLNAQALLKTISAVAPHSLILVPELLRLLINAGKRGWTPPSDLRFIAVGGAAVSASLLEDAAALGLPAYEGYGLSECASVVCLNTPDAAKRGSVGKPLPHVRVRFDEHGQLCVRGAVMQGYLGDPDQRVEEVATGDLGWMDADGFVYVRGRMKDMFISSMGRNVSPEWVESELLRESCIGQAVVIGEARPWPVALIAPATAQITHAQLERAIAAANARLPNYAQVRRWTALPEPLSFANGLLTANGRPKRDAIAARHASLLDELYATAAAS